MLDANRDDFLLGIVGAGLMGRGIAQVAALGGVRVLLFDSRAEAAAEARDELGRTLSMLAQKGKITEAAAGAALARIGAAAGLDGLAGCHVVVEAIVESLEAKRELFRQLEAVVADDCLLATNTSSLSVTAIAAACRAPQRVAGFHFFSPVPLMKVVEVVDGALTALAAGDALTALARRMGHAPVRAQDTPGFIVNHAGRGYLTEALRVLGEGIADHARIDRILRGAAGFRLGPFELLDLTGLDVSCPVMETIYHQYYEEPRYRPSPLLRQRLAAGLLGRKSGRGFYAYADGRAQFPAVPPVPPASMLPLWVGTPGCGAREGLLRRLEAGGARLDRGTRPAPESVCIVLPVGRDASTAALDEGLDPARTVAVDPLFLDLYATLMGTPLTTASARDAVWAALAGGGTEVTVIRDSAGFVAQRVVAMIVNIGCDIAQQRIATPQDIDRAVTLGLGYPLGPLAMGDALGGATVLAILDALHGFYRDPRYRPSPWLTRRARLGVSLLTPEP
ncbi:3-hydroxyacyl-CoA dehydrogenase [Pseudothauera rhizosphaerae]|uniref:3-hydroxyacyl-CoA dehydrogenase n=1 Tax=Pseudothauera rhizosphaerae TaxID=2565932 RepID=A0A4S4ALU6_9RHOO|nr:3-hydroxyacyl-CoA dehydrogenase [Pseudothauera rhizosphaerae]THF59270.1 3-hydroxyacyl-CoA dehydrogenase [Pseudothauera rhizosphaerae]